MPAPLAIPLIMSAAASLGQAVSGFARKRKAQKALDRFRRQNLQNVTKGMRVSTLGAELRAQEQARRFSTSVDALQGAGVRGLVGGLGRQEMISDIADQRTAAQLDQQQMMIERMDLKNSQGWTLRTRPRLLFSSTKIRLLWEDHFKLLLAP